MNKKQDVYTTHPMSQKEIDRMNLIGTEGPQDAVLRFKAQDGDLDFGIEYDNNDTKWLNININVPIMDNPPTVFHEDFVNALAEQGLDHMLDSLYDDVLTKVNEYIIIRALLKRQRP